MTEKLVFVVAYYETAEYDTASEAWIDGSFEPYDWFDTAKEAEEKATELRYELKGQHRKDVKILVRHAAESWCKAYLD